MRSKTVTLLAVAASLGVVQSASAADIPMKAPMMRAPAAVAFSWTGCYIGVNGGAMINDSRHTVRPTGDFLTPAFIANNPLRTDSADFDTADGTVGGTLGCNWQFSPNWVWGIEGDINWSGLGESVSVNRPLAAPLTGNFIHTVNHSVEWFSTVRGRIGWAVDRWFVYGTGGFAFGEVKSNSFVRFTAAGDTYIGAASDTKAGWTAGAGVEFAGPGNWTFKGEYLYVDLGSFSYLNPNVPPPAFPTFSYTTDVETQFHVFRVGVNYKFFAAP